ncbi:MAG: DUF4062 domain-containing protein [Phycisphaerae bacterium]|jgi:hypothetical protein
MNNRVFVSSTCYDLIDLRAEVESHLRSIGLAPVMSDSPFSDFQTFPAENSIEACLANVRTSQHVVVILSQRYGPLLEKYGHHKSATHLEYLEALKLKKPVVFLVRDKLYADFGIWKKNGRQTDIGYQWTQEEPERVKLMFEMIEEHERRVQGNGTTNWLDTFQTSLDLKDILSSRLKVIAAGSVLGRLMAKGDLPLVVLEVSGFTQDSNKKPSVVHVSACNVGRMPAIRTMIFINPRRNLKTKVSTGPVSAKPVHLGTVLMPSTPQEVRLHTLCADKLDYCYTVQASYETLEGYVIADEYVLVWSKRGVTLSYSGKRLIGTSDLALGAEELLDLQGAEQPSGYGKLE